MWTPIAPCPLSAPPSHGPSPAFWLGSELLVLAGNEGARYDPSRDTWTPVALGERRPPPGSTAVWTGDEALFFGDPGSAGSPAGVAYCPSTGAWRALAARGAPPPRTGHAAAWTGAEMLIACGLGSRALGDVFAYDPRSDRWKKRASCPAPRAFHRSVWTGSELLLFQGQIPKARGRTEFHRGVVRYDPSADRWTASAEQALPCPHATVTWAGSRLVVWGGYAGAGMVAEGDPGFGYLYDPGADAWTDVDSRGAPASRSGHAAVWTGDQVLIWGGEATHRRMLSDGALFDPVKNCWQPLGGPCPLAGRSRPFAVWTGGRMLVWGGLPQPGSSVPQRELLDGALLSL